MLPHTPVAVGHCPFSRNLFSELLLNKGQSPCQKQQPAWLLILIVPSPPWNGRTAQSHSWSRLLRRTSSSFWLVHEDRSFFTALVWWVCARYICTHRVHTTSRCRISAWRCVHSMGVDPMIATGHFIGTRIAPRKRIADHSGGLPQRRIDPPTRRKERLRSSLP